LWSALQASPLSETMTLGYSSVAANRASTRTTDEAMYSRIEFWIEKESYRPVKAKFYSDSGRLLKIAYYRKYERQLGSMRSTETIIIDGIDVNHVTKMTYSEFYAEDAKDAWFQRDYLSRFKEE